MFCKRWRPEVLLAIANRLAELLIENRHVTGVALTGSLARLESNIHDIDLVVFHDGTLKDGSAPDPPGPKEYDYEDSFPLDVAFVVPERDLVRSLREASSGTPVNYIFVEEKVLFDCAHLQSLEAREHFKDFYTRMFCDIPLVLLRPRERRGMLKERLSDESIAAFEIAQLMSHNFDWQLTPSVDYPGLPIVHSCENPGCRPKTTWGECREEIRRRKGHWWHPFMALVGR